MNSWKNILITSVIIILIVISCNNQNDELKIVDTMLEDTSSYFYTDLNLYKNKNSKLPVGIFDSGTGGLTVFDAIVNFDKYNNKDHSYLSDGDSIRDFNEECFIYLADQANMPYGNYEAHNKTKLLKEHVLKDAQFLLSDKYYENSEDQDYLINKSPIKALVIACNTATAYAKEDIENFVKKANLDIKVIGVIGAGVRASLVNISDDEDVSIAVMATAGTVSSNGYVKEIQSQLKERNNTGTVDVFQQAGIGLAGAIDQAIEFIDPNADKPRDIYKGPSDKNENLIIDKNILTRYNFDWSENNMLFEGTKENPTNIQINSVENYISYHVTTLLEQIIKSENPNKLKSIILGCTHYPFYTDIFNSKIEELRLYIENGKYIYKNILAEKIDFIDPAIFTAKELYDYLAQEKLFNDGNITESEFYISVPNKTNRNIKTDKFGNFEYDYKYGRNENEIQEYVKRVPFSKTNIPENVAKRLEEKIPYTYSLIKNFDNNNLKTAYLSENEKLK
ncbi:MAG: aspartate/glutamate racemase family protein [Ignavibacteriales bacterium]|nr:aspartate/glutamate racemase family protein [Ignavibacteriales bacterium]